MREQGRLEPWARPGTNPDDDEEGGLAASNIKSPLKTVSGDDVRLDNANTTTLLAGFATADLNTDSFNGFAFPKLAGALVVPVPATPLVGIIEGRKITMQITSRGNAADTVTLTGGAGGFLWPTTGIGPFQSDFDAAVAAMADGDVLLVGAQYHTGKNRWLVNALAGPYT